MRALVEWLEDRTGLATILHAALYEPIPGGARWRYVWGSTLTFCFFVQVITGIALWMNYSPSAQTAWESVYYIQCVSYGGWLVRGMHHFTAQAMVVLLALHFFQVVIDGAYRAPREINFWLGLVLAQIVLGLALTGYLLPWDQKGYWATKVATSLTGLAPLVGPSLQRLAIGGSEYGHHTLTRFFAMHAGVLPALAVIVLTLHVALFRRHGLTARIKPGREDGVFWPDQILRDAVACLAVLAIVLFFCVRQALTDEASPLGAGHWLGAELGAPADPNNPPDFPRPEWYFLFLFQLLKYFPGSAEVVGAIYVPGIVLLLVALMPLVGRWRLGHGFNVALSIGLLLGAAALTSLAWWDDHQGPEAARFAAAGLADHATSERARTLASAPSRIPVAGAAAMLRQDPLTVGPKLFERNCASCHFYAPPGSDVAAISKEATAGNLYGFASRAWIAGVLDPARVAGPDYFGRTAHAEGDMCNWVKENVPGFSPEQRQSLQDAVLALSAEAHLPAQQAQDDAEAAAIDRGRQAIAKPTDEGGLGCVDCHKLGESGDLGTAPELTGYGSRAWLIDFLSNPAAEKFYGDRNDRMPAFAERMSSEELALLADWLRGDWHGAPVAAAATSTAPPKSR